MTVPAVSVCFSFVVYTGPGWRGKAHPKSRARHKQSQVSKQGGKVSMAAALYTRPQKRIQLILMCRPPAAITAKIRFLIPGVHLWPKIMGKLKLNRRPYFQGAVGLQLSM